MSPHRRKDKHCPEHKNDQPSPSWLRAMAASLSTALAPVVPPPPEKIPGHGLAPASGQHRPRARPFPRALPKSPAPAQGALWGAGGGLPSANKQETQVAQQHAFLVASGWGLGRLVRTGGVIRHQLPLSRTWRTPDPQGPFTGVPLPCPPPNTVPRLWVWAESE